MTQSPESAGSSIPEIKDEPREYWDPITSWRIYASVAVNSTFYAQWTEASVKG